MLREMLGDCPAQWVGGSGEAVYDARGLSDPMGRRLWWYVLFFVFLLLRYLVEKEVKKNMLGFFVLIAVIAFIVGIICMAGVNYFMLKGKHAINISFLVNKMATPTPTTEIRETPTPTPKAVKLDAYNISILNGSGITGEAGKLKTTLTGDGFKVDSTGNADSSDYTATIISAGKDVDPAYLSKLKDELKKTYKLGTDKTIASGSSTTDDVIITIGSTTAGK